MLTGSTAIKPQMLHVKNILQPCFMQLSCCCSFPVCLVQCVVLAVLAQQSAFSANNNGFTRPEKEERKTMQTIRSKAVNFIIQMYRKVV